MNDQELMGKALHVAREASLLLLRKHGTVLPFGLALDTAGDHPRTWFPRDQLPRASWDELLDATVGQLERSSGSAGAIALATTLESGGKSGLGIQVETRASSLFLVYPYSGSGQRWSLEEPQTAEGLLVGPLMAVKKRR